MNLVPNSCLKDSMLKEIGFNKIDDLFFDIPNQIKAKELNLPLGLSQQETEKKLREIAYKNQSVYDVLSFRGGGIKPHYIPAVVKSVISRAEFFTAYTPYQSEASQGFLQAMFEYQSLIAELTGMDVANASLYDCATALGEAALISTRINGRKKFLIPRNISWEKKSVLKNYLKGPNIELIETPFDIKTGKIDLDHLEKNVDENTSGVYIENPNFFGIFEDDVDKIQDIIKNKDALFIVGIDPISLGITKSPGEYGADIVIGEGRALGNFIDFGGSSLGIFASKKEYVRQMPGRLIGLTKDKGGKRAFCMTLQTREQHIRRGKATSNICTNEGLCAIAAVSFLSVLGGDGFENLSRINFENGQILASKIKTVNGFKMMFDSIHFNEFVVKCDKDQTLVNQKLLKKGIQGGLVIDNWYEELSNCMLFGTTELHCESDFDEIVSALKEV